MSSARLFVGPGIRKPLDPNQNARNFEAVLKVTDPRSNKEVNVLKCFSLSWSRLSDEKCSLICGGELITKNQELLERIIHAAEALTWRLDSTAGPKGSWVATLQGVPDFSRDEVEVVIVYDPRSGSLPVD